MAGNKTVPLRWGEGGPVIGTATVDENGIITAEIEDIYAEKLGFNDVNGLSVSTKEE